MASSVGFWKNGEFPTHQVLFAIKEQWKKHFVKKLFCGIILRLFFFFFI
jgi:hypothetical protein